MSNTPFEEGQLIGQHKPDSQQYPWDKKETLSNIPGTRGREHHEQRLCGGPAGLTHLQTTFGMEVARMATMAAAPPRPGQHQLHTAGRRPDQSCEQMAHFRNRQGKQGEARWWGIKSSRGDNGKRLRTNPGKVRMRQHHQRDVTQPSGEAPHLIMVHPQIFGGFKVFFDVPTRATGCNHLFKRGPRRGEDKVIRRFVHLTQTTAHKQPMLPILLPLMQDGDGCPVKESWTFASLAHRETLPIPLTQQEGFHLTDFHASASPIRGHDPDRFIAGYRQHVGIAMCFQPKAQIQVAA
jgi:hypothetical protein